MFQKDSIRKRSTDNETKCPTTNNEKSVKIDQDDVGVPGLRKVWDPKYNRCEKLFWLFAVLCCLGICFYQVFVLIRHYLSCPISVEIKIMRNDSLDFPAITLCPAVLDQEPESFKSELQNYLMSECLNQDLYYNNCTLSLSSDNISLQHFWNKVKIDREEFSIWSTCGTRKSAINESHCKDGQMDYPMSMINIQTVHGTCLSLYPNEPMLYKGPDTFIGVRRIKPRHSADIKYQYLFPGSLFKDNVINILKEPTINFTFLLHSPEIIPRHDASYLTESIFTSYFTELRLAVKEFRFLNTTDNPCTDEKTFTECRNRCIDEKLNKQMICRLPFTENEIEDCTNITEAKTSYTRAKNFYSSMKLSKCNCTRKCRDIMYSFTLDRGFKPPDQYTTLHVYYPVNIHEAVIESYSYSTASLLSDIAGSVGFYLGVCVLTVVEIFDNIMKKKVNKKQEISNSNVM